MEPENDIPPPYSEVDPQPSNPDVDPQPPSLTSASRVSLRGGYLRGVPFHEDSSTTSFFQDRPFEFRSDRPVIVINRDITPETTREDIQLPNSIGTSRNVTLQDWQTFVNYILTELGNETPNTKKKSKQRVTPESFQACQAKIDAVVAEWNEGFFQPRSIKFVPRFYYNQPPSPSPTHRTVSNVQAAPANSQPAYASVQPKYVPPPIPFNYDGDMEPGMRGREGPFGHRGSSLGYRGGSFGGPVGAPGGPFGHAGEPFQRGGFRGRGRGGHHHLDNEVEVPRRKNKTRRSDSLSSSSSSSSDSSSDSDSDNDHHFHGGRRHGGRRSHGERRGRGRHREGRHRRSLSTSSSSSDSSVGSISSSDLGGVDMDHLRTTFANFQLDPLDRRQHKAAYRQLRDDLRSHQKDARMNKHAVKREVQNGGRAQKKELKSELRNLKREVKKKKREAKREYKAAKREQKKLRKEAKKAGRRRASEPGLHEQVHDRNLDEQLQGSAGGQENGTIRGPGLGFTSTTVLPTYEQAEKERSKELSGDSSTDSSRREIRRKARELDRQARDLERNAREREREAELRRREYESQAHGRRAEVERQIRDAVREAEREVRRTKQKGGTPSDLQTEVSIRSGKLRKEAEETNAREEENCNVNIAIYQSQAHELRQQAELIAAEARGVWDSLENGPLSARSMPERALFMQPGEVDHGDSYGIGRSIPGQGFSNGCEFGTGAGPSVRVRGFGTGFGTRAGNQGEALGRNLEAWGNRFGRYMERWGEDFGRQMEAHGQALERKLS